jgi:hypothetical protein
MPADGAGGWGRAGRRGRCTRVQAAVKGDSLLHVALLPLSWEVTGK